MSHSLYSLFIKGRVLSDVETVGHMTNSNTKQKQAQLDLQ